MARLLLIALALAAATLPALPIEPAFDAFGWLVWGRELTAFDLATGAGPAWKPLTSFAAAPLTLLGDGAAELGWLLIARTGAIAMLLLAARLATRLLPAGADRRATAVAAVVAALCALLIADSFTPLSRQFAIGMAEPLAAALLLAAADRGLDRRWGSTAALLALAGLIRPETLALLGLLGAWLWRRERKREATLAGAALAAALALWLGPDLIGAGDALTGAGQARQAGDLGAGEGLEAIWRGLTMPLLAAWPLAAYAVVAARRRGDDAPGALALAAAVSFAVVAAMAAAGYPGLPRFLLPAAALVAALAGAGAGRLDAAARAAGGARAPALAGVALLLLGAGQAAIRLADAPAQADAIRSYDERLDGLGRLLAAIGDAPAEDCGRVEVSWFLAETKAAWELGLPIGSVTTASAPTAIGPGPALVLVDPQAGAATAPAHGGRTPLAAAGGWTAYAIDCATAASSGNRSTMAIGPAAAPSRLAAGSGSGLGAGAGRGVLR